MPERGPIANFQAHTGVNVMPSAGGLEMARQLLERETAVAPESPENGAALERTLARVSENLRRSVGDDGYEALLARAVARAQSDHPALVDIRGDGIAGLSMDRVTAGVDTHGAAVVTAALESLLATLVDVLSGLIGADMVMNLLDPDGLLPKTPQPGLPK
ncbi:MAG: hypothetical protein ABJC63_07655 [Gemmatimonadales bacterium]